ncbi:MAG TPA: HD domain-containing protein [Rhodanobacteraceae bacterium]|nr:HD domain-containing protein [Rhodanobacteraceae bacterium]
MIEHDRLAAALALAHDAHRIQKRKGTDIPYIAHPMAVASLVLEYGGSEDQAIAALLHDTVEDGGEAYAGRIGAAFGPGVLAMVRDCTDGSFEQKAAARTPHAKYAEWRVRKQAYMQHLRATPADSPALLVSACDKLHNARAILADLRLLGDALFDRFTGRRDGTLWYYDELSGIFADKGTAPARNLARAVAAMHAEVSRA